MADLMEKVVSLAKRRGFVFPGSDIYGGLANSWDYGPVGVELKKNVKDLWWHTFVHGRDDVVGIDAALIMNPRVWEASGHVANFSDPLVECTHCHNRFREDQAEEVKVPNSKVKHLLCNNCGKSFESKPKMFNLMFKTFIGSTEETSSTAYLRPETAQAMFVDFQNVSIVSPRKLPFGIAQMGKAFRNEITPGNFIFRTREFEQMEIEYFFPAPKSDSEWQEQFEMWRQEFWRWFDLVGIDATKVHEADIPDGERAHYSKRTIDFEFEYPFGRKELYGLAYRTDFDLNQHQTHSGKNLKYKDPMTGEEYIPHCIEPTWGVDRTVLAVLLSSYKEDGDRIYMAFPPAIAPYKAAVFPLVKNKPEIVAKAREIYTKLKSVVSPVVWDERGNIGKRYYSQDEIGTPFCITVDYDTLESGTVTVRDRNTATQEKVAVEKLNSLILEKVHTT